VAIISGAVLADGRGRAELDTMVRYMSASTWVDEHALHWRESLMEAHNADDARAGIPDWLRLGAVAIIADASEAAHATEFMRTHLAVALPLRELFALRLRSDDDLSIVGPQAASVVAYLRAMQGPRGLRNLFGMLATGADLPTALSAMHRPATIESRCRVAPLPERLPG
jgi:hypothetical protein